MVKSYLTIKHLTYLIIVIIVKKEIEARKGKRSKKRKKKQEKEKEVKKKSEAQFRTCLIQTGAILASDFWVDLFCCLRLLLELAHTTSTIQPERERPL